MKQLNGNIHVIRGNHDTDRRWKEYAEIGCILHGWSDVIKVNGYKFYLCHYPTETSCLENCAKLKAHLINLHGHTHVSHKFEHNKPYQYNVALDAHNNYPVSFDDIIQDIQKEVQVCLSYL